MNNWSQPTQGKDQRLSVRERTSSQVSLKSRDYWSISLVMRKLQGDRVLMMVMVMVCSQEGPCPVLDMICELVLPSEHEHDTRTAPVMSRSNNTAWIISAINIFRSDTTSHTQAASIVDHDDDGDEAPQLHPGHYKTMLTRFKTVSSLL